MVPPHVLSCRPAPTLPSWSLPSGKRQVLQSSSETVPWCSQQPGASGQEWPASGLWLVTSADWFLLSCGSCPRQLRRQLHLISPVRPRRHAAPPPRPRPPGGVQGEGRGWQIGVGASEVGGGREVGTLYLSSAQAPTLLPAGQLVGGRGPGVGGVADPGGPGAPPPPPRAPEPPACRLSGPPGAGRRAGTPPYWSSATQVVTWHSETNGRGGQTLVAGGPRGGLGGARGGWWEALRPCQWCRASDKARHAIFRQFQLLEPEFVLIHCLTETALRGDTR